MYSTAVTHQKSFGTFMELKVARGGAVGWGAALQTGSIPDDVPEIFQ